MGIDLDLSAFRLVKSFAAVEISKNVGTSGSEDVAGAAQAESVRPRDTAVPAPTVQAGLSAAATNPAPSAIDQIPERLDDGMRAALDQGLEGAERAAVSWQHGQRSAALSLAGLARPGGSPDSRQSRRDASGQAVVHEPDPADAAAVPAPIARTNAETAPVRTNLVQAEPAASEQNLPFSATAALPLAKTSSQPALLTAAIPDNEAVADALTAAVRAPIARLSAETTPVRTNLVQAEPAASEPNLPFSATAALPLAKTSSQPAVPTVVIVDDESVADAFTAAVPSDSRRADGGLEKPQFLLASAISLFGEAQVVDALQSMVDEQSEDGPAAAASDRKPGQSGPILLAATDESASQNVILRDLVQLSQLSLGDPALGDEQVDVPGARSGDEEPLADQQGVAARSSAQTNMASRTLAATALKPELPRALPAQLSKGQGSQAIAGGGAEQSKLVEQGPVADGKPSELAAIGPAGKAAVAGDGVKVLEILDALVAMSAWAGEGSEDWQPLSLVILNAAMIPGWPPPRPVENPASVRQADLLMQVSPSAEPEETPMTPEQLLAYLVSIGANVRLLRALQELVSRVGKKDGPALLAWLAGLVSALKVIEKSLKDIVEDGMELPEWLAELADAAKRRRRRKQFQI